MKSDTFYTLVLSDLHFGDTRCTLHQMRTAEALVERLKAYCPLREIILLGDILDLQLANWAQAIEGMILPPNGRRTVGFRHFLNYLLEKTGARNIIYIPGNHDYRIFDYHSIDKHLIDPLRSGRKLSGKIAFFRSFSDSFLQGIVRVPDVKLTITYPHLSLKVNNARVILTHGHLFDPTQAFNHEVGKLFSKAASLSKKDIAKLRHGYLRRVSLYQNVVTTFMMRKELRNWFSSIYHPYTTFKDKIRRRKHFLTPAMIESIQQYVTFCCRAKRADGVIFGHTHRPGKAELKNGCVGLVWNTGSFLRETKYSPDGSYITIRHDGKTPIVEAIRVHDLRI